MTAMSGSSRQLTLKKGAPGDLLWVQLASYLEGDPLMWMIPLHLHINQKSDYDDDVRWFVRCQLNGSTVFSTKKRINLGSPGQELKY